MESEKERNRIRDNQRRSRARKKAYVADLENRLRECQLKGIEASSEVQQAARRVADENHKLRQILGGDYGLSDAQIDQRLSPDGQSQAMTISRPRTALDNVMVSTRPDCLDLSKTFRPRDQQKKTRPTLPYDRLSDSSAESFGSISSNAPQPPYGVNSATSMSFPTSAYIQPGSQRLPGHGNNLQASIWPPGNPVSPTDGLSMNMQGYGANQALDFHSSFPGTDATNSLSPNSGTHTVLQGAGYDTMHQIPTYIPSHFATGSAGHSDPASVYDSDSSNEDQQTEQAHISDEYQRQNMAAFARSTGVNADPRAWALHPPSTESGSRPLNHQRHLN